MVTPLFLLPQRFLSRKRSVGADPGPDFAAELRDFLGFHVFLGGGHAAPRSTDWRVNLGYIAAPLGRAPREPR